jgi:hypothetical protein
MKSRRRSSMTGDLIKTGVGNIVGVGLIGASATAAGALPAGMAKDFAGTAVGLQGVALIGHNLKPLKKVKLI